MTKSLLAIAITTALLPLGFSGQANALVTANGLRLNGLRLNGPGLVLQGASLKGTKLQGMELQSLKVEGGQLVAITQVAAQ